jgi:hypothetical protein
MVTQGVMRSVSESSDSKIGASLVVTHIRRYEEGGEGRRPEDPS